MPGKILVVDDVATNRILLKTKLAHACYDVVQAADGESALDRAHADRPDLVLLDLAMPGMPGLEVLARLKRDRETAGIPVIVVTAHADTRSRIAALRAGAEDFLAKPVDEMALLARVRALLRTRPLADELSLRDGTRAALGFAEGQTAFPGPADDPAKACAIALVGPDRRTAGGWRTALAGRLPHRLEIMAPAQALRLAREADPAEPRAAPIPEVFVLAADLGRAGDGLRLLAELRSGPATRNAAILVALASGDHAAGATALDLGASDLLDHPLDPEETALRLSAQLRRKRAAEAMRRRLREGLQLAVTDPLTGLPNRRYALSHLERVAERAAQRGRPFAALLLDLDRFKSVNDAHGHAAGDAVLAAIADRLQGALRPVDLLARYGGEEFLAVLPEASATSARDAAERLRRTVADTPVPLPRGGAVAATVSIGLACSAPDARTEADRIDVAGLLERADRALYAAKAAGRDRVAAAPADGSGEVAA